MRTMTLPESLTTIGTNVFKSMSELKLVVSRSSNQVTCGTDVFASTTSDLEIFINKESTDEKLCSNDNTKKTVSTYGETGTYIDYITTTSNEMIIYGKGEMNNFEKIEEQPWKLERTNIQTIKIDERVTTIGKNAFNSFEKLETVTIQSTITTIG